MYLGRKKKMTENIKQRLEEIINHSNNNKEMKLFFDNILSSKVYIYGAGNAGALTYKLLQQAGIMAEGFFDRRADNISLYLGKPVLKAEDERVSAQTKLDAYVIISFLCSYDELQDIKNWLLSLGYKNICYYHDIYNLMITRDLVNDGTMSVERTKILDVAEALCDSKSRNVYYNFFNAILNANPDLFSKPDEEKQYFIRDISLEKGYSRFIDCGAYTGDTASDLRQFKGLVDKIVLFEPDNNNFLSLREQLDKTRIAKEELLYPCGVWKQSEMLRFKSGVDSVSTISEEGDVFIQCVAMDDVIRDFAPTFIKMDIEGAEYEALMGAEKIIKQYTPDLAISVYHKIDHMWEIPLLVRAFNPNYKLYLRSHGLHGAETILYATCEEKL